MGFPSTRQIPQIYSNEWKDWDDLFGIVQSDTSNVSLKDSKTSFIQYEVFNSLIKADGIDNHENYQLWYEENRDIFNVPKHPEEVYPELKDWKVLQETSPQPQPKPQPKPQPQNKPHQAMQRPVQQPITGRKLNKRKKRTTKPPHQKRIYPSYTDLQIQVQKLGIASRIEYETRYDEIPDAPSAPHRTYKEWKGWYPFLGTRHHRKRKRQYLSYTDLQIQVQKLGITSSDEYLSRYNEIPGAPSTPYRQYKEWKNWYVFLGTSPQQKQKRKQQYLPYKKLKTQVQALNITSAIEYQRRYTEIPGAPSHPHQIYTEWENWYAFLGTSPQKKQQYLPYQKLQKKVQALGIKTSSEYQSRYKEIPGAPSHPHKIYTEWKGWSPFLGISPQQKRKQQYLPYKKLKTQVQALGITTRTEYEKRYKEIPDAPSHPDRTYTEWENWPTFLGKICMEQFRLEKNEH